MRDYRPHLRGRLREAFWNADRQEVMKRLRSEEEFRKAGEIMEKARMAKADLRDRYRERYEARVRQEAKRVREENTAPGRHSKPGWVWEDRLDPEFVREVAEKRVRDREEMRNAAIDTWERSALRLLARLPTHEMQEPIGLVRDFARALRRAREN